MIKIILLLLIMPVIAFYAGFTIGGLIFAIHKEIKEHNERRKPKK